MTPLNIAGRIRPWVSYPGLFAAGRIDEGTALLLDVLPPLSAGARIADFGCGSGVIGAALAELPGIGLDMIDHDSLALLAARENVPAGRALLASSLSQAGGALYDAILSNPPLHAGMTREPCGTRRSSLLRRRRISCAEAACGSCCSGGSPWRSFWLNT